MSSERGEVYRELPLILVVMLVMLWFFLLSDCPDVYDDLMRKLLDVPLPECVDE